jgi:hypothetical protein
VSARRELDRARRPFRLGQVRPRLARGWPRRRRPAAATSRRWRAGGRSRPGPASCRPTARRPAPARGPAVRTMTASHTPSRRRRRGPRPLPARLAPRNRSARRRRRRYRSPIRATAGARYRGGRRARQGGRPLAGSGRVWATLPVRRQKSVWPSRGAALRRSRFAARRRFDGACCRSSARECRQAYATTLRRSVKH